MNVNRYVSEIGSLRNACPLASSNDLFAVETDLDDARSEPSANHGGLHGHCCYHAGKLLHRKKSPRSGRNSKPIRHKELAQPAGRALPAAGEVQRRADLGAAARRRRARRPDFGRRLRPDGRDRRVRPDSRREVRNVLRAAHPRRDARRAAHHGLGAAAGAQQGQQAQRGHQDRWKPSLAARRTRTSWRRTWA